MIRSALESSDSSAFNGQVTKVGMLAPKCRKVKFDPPLNEHESGFPAHFELTPWDKHVDMWQLFYKSRKKYEIFISNRMTEI